MGRSGGPSCPKYADKRGLPPAAIPAVGLDCSAQRREHKDAGARQALFALRTRKCSPIETLKATACAVPALVLPRYKATAFAPALL